jgi:FkbM family methyltransferase
MARRVFPDAQVLMVEAQEVKRPFLEAVCCDLPGVIFANTLLADAPGETVTFYEMETGSSMMPENSNVPRIERKLRTGTLDELAHMMGGPLFLKLDVQGAELKVLAGGKETISRAEVVQLEVALLPYNKDAPTFLETITYMDDRDFVPLDFSGFVRPDGGDLVQVDILFVKRDSDLRPNFFNF